MPVSQIPFRCIARQQQQQQNMCDTEWVALVERKRKMNLVNKGRENMFINFSVFPLKQWW